jgi:hypothetical protein
MMCSNPELGAPSWTSVEALKQPEKADETE